MYSVRGYGEMIADRVRMEAYVRALAETVNSESTVLDLGCGPGVTALIAARLGGKQVIAIEPDDVIALAREIAAANGFGDRVQFLQGMSNRLEPPALCDVVVSDLHGILPHYQQHIPTIVDIRERWLAPQGRLIPQSDTVFGAVVSSETQWDKHFCGWFSDADQFDLHPGAYLVANTVSKAYFEEADLLTRAEKWADIDYRTVTSANHDATVEWTVERDGTAHGLCAWFDSRLTDSVRTSNRPGAPRMIYGQLYFPWPRPVTLSKNDRVVVRLRVNMIGGESTWTWESSIHSGQSADPTKAFRQSSFLGNVWTRVSLAPFATSAQPTLGVRGRAARDVLVALDGTHTLNEIAAELVEQHPEEFRGLPQAVRFVSGLVRSYGPSP